MAKLCCIFNTPSLYRERIYSRIEAAYDCDWFFEDTDNQLQEFDTAQLRRVERLRAKDLGPFYWVKGTLALLRRKEYDQYLMMGHSRNLSTLVFLLLKKVFCPRKRAYLWTHGFYGKETFAERCIKRLTLGLADELLVYGDYACGLMRQMGFKAEKLHAIHNSLDYDTQLALRQQMAPTAVYSDHFGNSQPVLLFIGRLTSGKRLDLLVDAVARLRDAGRHCNLALIGDGPERVALEAQVAALGLSRRVWFYGACYDETANAELVYNADLCVAPGNIGLTSIHALMFGCPALTHNDFAHQMPEFEVIKEGETGAFFQRDDIGSMVSAIDNWFLASASRREEVRQACYAVIDTNWNPDYQMGVLAQVIR